jgi:hypothetical protein
MSTIPVVLTADQSVEGGEVIHGFCVKVYHLLD